MVDLVMDSEDEFAQREEFSDSNAIHNLVKEHEDKEKKIS